MTREDGLEFLGRTRALAAAARRALAAPPSGAGHWWIWPVLMSGLILAQHWSYATRPEVHEGAWKIREVTGVHEANLYDYSMHYWGLVPVYSVDVLGLPRGDDSLYSEEEAERILVERGHTLRMEHNITLRTGERTVRVMKYPLALWKGSAFQLRYELMIGGIYAFGLILLSLALWRYAPFPLCIFLPLVVGSSAFVAADIYRWQRPLTVLIIAPIYAMALLAPVVFDRPMRTRSLVLRLVALAGFLVLMVNLRRTPIALLPCIAIVLLLYRQRGLLWRLAQVGVFLVSFVALSWSFDAWWEGKYQETLRVVKAVGGVPFQMRVNPHHDVWHTIFIGFEDFDTKYDFRWRDFHGHQYARPLLEEMGFEPTEDEVRYGVLWQKVPGYDALIRDRLLEIVREDPGWYLRVVRGRIQRILWENEGPRLNLVFADLQLPSSPWPYLGFALLLVAIGALPFLKLLVLALPTVSVPLLVTTYGGQQHLSITHLVVAAMLLTACWMGASAGTRHLRSTAGKRR